MWITVSALFPSSLTPQLWLNLLWSFPKCLPDKRRRRSSRSRGSSSSRSRGSSTQSLFSHRDFKQGPFPGAGSPHCCQSMHLAQTRMPFSLVKMRPVWLLPPMAPSNEKQKQKQKAKKQTTNPWTQLCPLNKQLPALPPASQWNPRRLELSNGISHTPSYNHQRSFPATYWMHGGEKEYILINRGEKWFGSSSPVL